MKRQYGQLTTVADALAYILAGCAVFTLVSKKTGARYTYRVSAGYKGDDPKQPVDRYWVKLLTGPENEQNYTYLGMIRPVNGGPPALGKFELTQASKMTCGSLPVAAFAWAWQRLLDCQEMPAMLEIWHTGRCGRCGRLLTVPASVARGIGPECATRI